MRLRFALITATAFALASCTLTLPVTGQLQTTNEAFTGHATGHMDAAGEIELVMANGVKCQGTFVYVNPRQGAGTIKCSDGRSGTLEFVSTGKRGTGSGVLNGAPFTFTFG